MWLSPRSCSSVLLGSPSHAFAWQFPCQELPALPFMRSIDLHHYQVSPNPTYLLPHPWSLSSSASEPHQVWEETQAYGPRQAGPGGLDRPEGCYLDPQDKEATCHTSPCGPVTRMNI